MKTTLYKADSRGKADLGWLKTNYSFSFSGYYNPERMHFGMLRVLNDDFIAGGMGFGMHHHENMEIITIPTSGELEHKDSMGNTGVIRKGEVQVMSAGSGIEHSEYNKNPDTPVTLFQVWVFPNKKNVTPRYDQKAFDTGATRNKFLTIVSPMGEKEGLNIHQDAWLSLGNFDANSSITYLLKNNGNGVYVFVIEGDITVNGEKLGRRDALGITDAGKLDIKAATDAEILLMEIPMN